MEAYRFPSSEQSPSSLPHSASYRKHYHLYYALYIKFHKLRMQEGAETFGEGLPKYLFGLQYGTEYSFMRNKLASQDCFLVPHTFETCYNYA